MPLYDENEDPLLQNEEIPHMIQPIMAIGYSKVSQIFFIFYSFKNSNNLIYYLFSMLKSILGVTDLALCVRVEPCLDTHPKALEYLRVKVKHSIFPYIV